MVKSSAYNAGDLGLIPGLGRSPGEGNGSLLQYCCLENPVDRGAWQAAVHGVAKRWTQLSNFTFTFNQSISFQRNAVFQFLIGLHQHFAKMGFPRPFRCLVDQRYFYNIIYTFKCVDFALIVLKQQYKTLALQHDLSQRCQTIRSTYSSIPLDGVGRVVTQECTC